MSLERTIKEPIKISKITNNEFSFIKDCCILYNVAYNEKLTDQIMDKYIALNKLSNNKEQNKYEVLKHFYLNIKHQAEQRYL